VRASPFFVLSSSIGRRVRSAWPHPGVYREDELGEVLSVAAGTGPSAPNRAQFTSHLSLEMLGDPFGDMPARARSG
jgi:hypothetical protein